MNVARVVCPNCGHRLVTLRTDRQWAGSRQVELHWCTCRECGHVQLQRWSFVESDSDSIVDEVTLTQEARVGARQIRVVSFSGRSAATITMAIATALAVIAGIVAHRHCHHPHRHAQTAL